MIQVAPDRWVNPRYIVGAVLHDGDDPNKPERTLTLSLDGSTDRADQFINVTGLWIGYVMGSLGIAEEAK